MITGALFDFYFFWFNEENSVSTLFYVFGLKNSLIIGFSLLMFMVSCFVFFINIKSSLQINIKKRIYITSLILSIVISAIFIPHYLDKKNFLVVDFIERTFFRNSKIIREYNKYYTNLLDNYSNFNINNFDFRAVSDRDIYFIHLESVNNDFVNNDITPNLINYSDKYGIRFENYYANSIQTLSAQENILCAMPPSIFGYLNNNYDISRLICLPKILRSAGYKSLFFKSHDLNYSKTGKFMKNIGFDEIHNGDIMQENDPRLEWGYREDVFYKRVWEYLNKYKSQKKFVYIAVSSTNHYPFNGDYSSLDVPNKDPKTFRERIANKVYLQDAYLKVILEDLINDNHEKYIFVFSDHSWPIGIHYKNEFNQDGAYDENFHTTLSFLPITKDKNDFLVGKKSEKNIASYDILNTVLDLLNIKSKNQYIGESFYNEFKKIDDGQITSDECVLSIQPFSDIYFSFVIGTKHYIYNVFKNVFEYYDLSKDRYEKNPMRVNEDSIEFYKKCMNINK